eukprot:7974694-Pyramimonas_sp.AAC.1
MQGRSVPAHHSGALGRGSVQTGVSQSARCCRILQGQGRIDPGLGAGPCLGAGFCRILQDSARFSKA